MKKIEAVSAKLHPSAIQQLTTLLGISISDRTEVPDDLYALCQQWFSITTEPRLSTLIRALLCTQGLGHLVTGLLPICEFLIII